MINETAITNGLALIFFLGLSYFLIWRQYRRSAEPALPTPSSPPHSLIKAQVDPILVDTAESLIQGLIESKGRHCSDQELLDAIGRRLTNYTWLENPDFIRALNYYLQTEGQRLAGKSFPTYRLEEVWDKFRRLMERERRNAQYSFIVHPKNQQA